MPGIGLDIEGAVQQAPQSGRQSISNTPVGWLMGGLYQSRTGFTMLFILCRKACRTGDEFRLPEVHLASNLSQYFRSSNFTGNIDGKS
jgi:hypothetical protein